MYHPPITGHNRSAYTQQDVTAHWININQNSTARAHCWNSTQFSTEFLYGHALWKIKNFYPKFSFASIFKLNYDYK